ncbi:hypothetical protein PCE1_000424 [Barthelona sp. PCE]
MKNCRIIFVLIFFLGFSIAFDCSITEDGSFPAYGQCPGPTARARLRASNLDVSNGGCPATTVMYYPEDDMSLPSKCGECIPGKTFVDDSTALCAVDEFCSDEGKCVKMKQSVFHGKYCPYEAGGATKNGICGPGLRCIQHMCLPCRSGEKRSNGLACVANSWTLDPYTSYLVSPPGMVAVCNAVLLLVFLFILVGIKRENKKLKND